MVLQAQEPNKTAARKTMKNMDTNTNTPSTMDKIDAAIKAAEARKAAKASSAGTNKPAIGPKPAKPVKGVTEKAASKKANDEEKAAKKAARDTERAEKKAIRDKAREEKRAAKEASKKPAHMLKVMKAAEKLPKLDANAQVLFNDITSNLPQSQVAAVALHLQHFNRVKATERALTQKIEAGMSVRIIGGDPRYIGATGTVDRAQRIRCYVNVVGAKKPVYLFTSDVEQVKAAKKTGTGK